MRLKIPKSIVSAPDFSFNVNAWEEQRLIAGGAPIVVESCSAEKKNLREWRAWTHDGEEDNELARKGKLALTVWDVFPSTYRHSP